MTIGQKIKTLRKHAHMTQTELGEILGVKKNAVSKWECGRVEDIPASKIKAMAKLFEVPPSYLIDNDAVRVYSGDEYKITDEDVKFALFGADPDVTDEMYEDVKQFAAFIAARSKMKKE